MNRYFNGVKTAFLLALMAAVNFALRWVATEPMNLEEALAMEGACAVDAVPVDEDLAGTSFVDKHR